MGQQFIFCLLEAVLIRVFIIVHTFSRQKVKVKKSKKLVEQMFEFQKTGVNNFIFRDPVFSINETYS